MRVRLDPYVVVLMAALVAGSLAPPRGAAATLVGWATTLAIVTLFFLHGARLSWAAVRAGLVHWRLQSTVLAASFVLFPALGLAAVTVLPFPEPLGAGVVYLCCLPSTIQSSLALVAVARGNLAAAVCAASLSNLLGVVVSPVLVSLLLAADAPITWGSAARVVLQLVVPFAAGQLARPWLAEGLARHRRLLGHVDRGSVALVVYASFGAAVVDGVWHRVPPMALASLVAVCLVLLLAALAATVVAARLQGFATADEVVLVLCGSKKSLATGAPMARALFPASVVGPVLLPLMLYHQLQLVVCALVAGRYAARASARAAERAFPDGR